MLVIALILSVLLLYVAIWAVRKSETPILVIIVAGLTLGVCPLAIMTMFPPVAIQAVLLVILAIVWAAFGWKSASFVPAACVATVLAFGIMAWLSWRDLRGLQNDFPFTSLEERVSPPRAALRASPLPAAVEKEMSEMESIYDEAGKYQPGTRRAKSLQELHENTVTVFVNNPGFGVSRMVSVPGPGLPDPIPIPTPVA
jgi:hypothetical protein